MNSTPAIRSFVRRQGRISNAQARALETLLPRYGIPYREAVLNLHEVFQRDAAKIFEIGFGMGEATAHIARTHPENDYLCSDVHTPGIGSLLKLIAEFDLNNIRIIQHDAVEILQHMLASQSLDGAHIFFPDPWPKKRHHKRRLLQTSFIYLLHDRLKPGGYIHAATDWQEYATHILNVLEAHPGLVNTAQDFAEKPAYRPTTKFEQRGLKLSHGVWDILFKKE